MSECGMVRVDKSIEVASGVFAPGHLGELTALVPFELVDAVLADTGRVQQRLRVLPSRVGVYVVLAAVLFPRLGLAGVWARLTAGLGPVSVPRVSEKALRDLRRRIGAAPIKALFQVVAGPTSWPRMRGVRYRRWRTVAVDGCCSMRLPDSPRNRAVFGYGRRNGAGYPMLWLVALVETGTRALIDAVFAPMSVSELTLAADLTRSLKADMLLLADRGFDADVFLRRVSDTGAAFLIRIRSNRSLPVLKVLPDGSFLTTAAGLPLRAICAAITVHGADGSATCGTWRLLTTLTDHRTDPATALVRLYHERWEIESAFYALRHTLCDQAVMRSQDPAGIEQEMWAQLTVYQLLRTAMADAIGTIGGADPDRCSFTVAVNTARDTITAAYGIAPDPGRAGTIDIAVQSTLLPARRARYSTRVLKSGGTRYPHTVPGDSRPRHSTTIEDIHYLITCPTPLPATPNPALIPWLATRYPGTGPTVLAALAILHTTPGTAHRARDLARTLGLTSPSQLNAFGVAMNTKAQQGHITKTAPGTYMLQPHP